MIARKLEKSWKVHKAMLCGGSNILPYFLLASKLDLTSSMKATPIAHLLLRNIQKIVSMHHFNV